MDRLKRSLTCCGIGLLLVAPGCKLTRPEVPPGRPFAQDGRQRPPVQFSNESHPMDGSATANLMPNSAGSTRMGPGVGVGTGRSGELAGGPGGSFGPPGTSGRPGDGIGRTTPSPTVDDDALPASTTPRRPSIEPIPSREPAPLPDPSASAPTLPPEAEPLPQAAPASAPGPGVGTMGEPGALPSPN